MNKSSILKLSLFAAVLTLACTSTLHAQSPAGRAQIKVPFAFEVGPDHFAPGVYTVSMLNGSTLYVRGIRYGAFAPIKSGDNSAITGGKVVFHRVGGQYFLSEVWSDGSKEPMVLYPSKAEKEALSRELAANHRTDQGAEVILAQAAK